MLTSEDNTLQLECLEFNKQVYKIVKINQTSKRNSIIPHIIYSLTRTQEMQVQ